MERDELVRHDYPPNGRPSESSRRITSCEEDRRRSSAACRHVLFLAVRHLWARTATGAPSCREMYPTTKEHFSDRTLKKATDANYVRHRESSIKTITRKNFGPGTHSPTLLPASKEQVAGFYRARRDPRALVETTNVDA
jgi:hypothetical protein